MLCQLLILILVFINELTCTPLMIHRNTKNAGTCLTKCINHELKQIKDIDDKADIRWYKAVDEYSTYLIHDNGSMNDVGRLITSEICSSIIPYAIPVWNKCADKCSKHDKVYTDAAKQYANNYLIKSCEDPEKYLKAQICLHQIIYEIDTSNYFIEKMEQVISKYLGKTATNGYKSIENADEIMKIAKQSAAGPDGMLCHRFIRVMDRFEDLELCGWSNETLIGMLNNKLSRTAILNDFLFTRIQDCHYE